MAKRLVEESSLTTIANAIRSKGGTSEQLAFPNGFKTAIEAIQTDSGVTPTGTIDITENGTYPVAEYAEANVHVTIQSEEGGIVPSGTITVNENGEYNVRAVEFVNVALPEAERATPSISVDANTGVITASARQDAGVVTAGTETATKQITHSNLTASNIKSGVTIFNVTGSYTGSGGSGGGSTVVEGDIEVGSLSELHSWNKYQIGGTVTETKVDTLHISGDQTGFDSIYEPVDYADEYDISNGKIVLVNPTENVTFTSSTDAQVLLGKYIQTYETLNQYATTASPSGIYYRIYSTAAVEYNRGGQPVVSRSLTVSPAYRLDYAGTDDQLVGIVVSEDSNAYPQNGVQDGYKYVYNGTLDMSECNHTAVAQATPSITVNATTGLITATSNQSAGLVSAGTKSATKQITHDKLTAENIKSGVSIFGVTGSYSGDGSVCNHTSVVQATPVITVDSTGKITASSTQLEGLVAAGTKTATNQLTTQGATTITPGNVDKTAVSAGKYTTGAVTVAGDDRLVASNIKSGVSIFGVTGKYTGETAVAGWAVEDVPGASYGFTLQDDGYYKSQNAGKDNSAALCKVRFKVNGTYNLYIDCIGSGEGKYDYGILSNLNSDLTTTSSEDTNRKDTIQGSASTQYDITKTVVYENISSDGYITIKYRKDTSSAKGDDCLRFKVRLELVSGSSGSSECNHKIIDPPAPTIVWASPAENQIRTFYTIESGLVPSTITRTSTSTVNHENLKSENIKSGVSIFGVTGSYAGNDLVTKTGTTTNSTFDTGLSEIVSVILHRHPVDSVGLAHAAIMPKEDICVYSGCMHTSGSEYISGMGYAPGNYVITGGEVYWKGTNSDFTKFKAGATYTWQAIGYE